MHIITYKGYFGFIKPQYAVRDTLTFSQNYLTQSNIMGIEMTFWPELYLKSDYPRRIIRHKVNFQETVRSQDTVHAQGLKWIPDKNGIPKYRNGSIINRYYLLHPIVYFAFNEIKYAEYAMTKHFTYGANECIMLPEKQIKEMTEQEFNDLKGYELCFKKESQVVGWNRYTNKTMMGELVVNW